MCFEDVKGHLLGESKKNSLIVLVWKTVKQCLVWRMIKVSQKVFIYWFSMKTRSS